MSETLAPKRSIIVTVSAAKGGVGKSWVAENLATFLGRELGFAVLLVDSNPACDAYRDIAYRMRQRGKDAYCQISNRAEILREGGLIDQSGHRWDIVVIDTLQLIESPPTKFAFTHCDHFVLPVNTTTVDHDNYGDTLDFLVTIRDGEGLPLPQILALPCRVNFNPKSRPRQQLVELLASWGRSGDVEVPDIAEKDFLDFNTSMEAFRFSRNIAAAERGEITPLFRAKVGQNMYWLMQRMLARHGNQVAARGALSSLEACEELEVSTVRQWRNAA